jgi:multidrug resistance efflux pump
LAQARDNLAIAEMSLAALQTRAGACVKSAIAKASRARSRADRYKATLVKNVISQEEYDEAEAGAVEAAANLEISRVQLVDVKTQERSLELRREDVSCAEAQVTIDQLTLTDAQERVAETKIHACMDGIVTGRFVQPGQIVSAGSSSAETRLLTLSDLSRVFVSASANASQFGQIKAGQPAIVKTEACPNITFTGRVIRVAPRGTAAGPDVSFDVKIEILSENRTLLKAEMPACVEFSEK